MHRLVQHGAGRSQWTPPAGKQLTLAYYARPVVIVAAASNVWVLSVKASEVKRANTARRRNIVAVCRWLVEKPCKCQRKCQSQQSGGAVSFASPIASAAAVSPSVVPHPPAFVAAVSPSAASYPAVVAATGAVAEQRAL